jgi:hypothetical protein
MWVPHPFVSNWLLFQPSFPGMGRQFIAAKINYGDVAVGTRTA